MPLLAIAVGNHLHGEQPLHVRIDQSMAEIHPGPEIPLCSDGEFLRRVYLDLIGRIPAGDEAHKFLADDAPDKRAKVIDAMLADAAHARHISRVFDVMLMERRAHKHVKKEQWDAYLLASFRQNKPFNQLAREILAADGVDEKQRGPAKFYLEREVEPNLLTREVGRIFFGMDLQCAQCHDHPSIDDYYQSDYYGLFAFVNRSYLFQPDRKKPAVLAEKAEGDAKFKSVFTEEEGSTLPRLPGSVEVDEPTLSKDEAYEVKPDPKKKDVRPVPKRSRRQQLANQATDGSNLAFNRNLANRLWAHMMGRGLVHPVDQHHSDNPPVHPQLLEMLAGELPKTGFDIRIMLRELALSNTYQRSIDLPRDFGPHAESASQQLDVWNARLAEIAQSVEQSQQVVDEVEEQLSDTTSEMPTLVDAEKKAVEKLAASRKAVDEANKKMSAGQAALAKHQNALTLLRDSVTVAKAAAAVLGDQSLGDPIKMLDQRRQAFETKVAEQTKSMAALTVSHTEATTKLTEAQKVASESSRKLKSARETAAPIAKSLAESKEKLRFHRTSASHAKTQISRLQSAIGYADAVTQRGQLQAELQRLASQITGSESKLAKLTVDAERLKKNLPAAESGHKHAVAAAGQARKQLDSTRDAANLINESLAQANEAANLFSDAQLQDALAKLESSSRDLSNSVASHEQLLAESSAQEKDLANRLQMLRETMQKTSDDRKSAEAELAALQRQQSEKSQRLSQTGESLQAHRAELASAWSNQFSIGIVQPLSPEQLAWSILHTTGQMDRQRRSIEASIEKKTPLKPEEKNDPVKLAARKAEVEKQLEKTLTGIVDRFVRLFGAAAGQPQDDFFATVDQALFMRNGGEVRSWLSPSAGNLTDRLQKFEDTNKLAEDLYLSILTRTPTEDETADVAKYLATPDLKKVDVIQEMAWALLTSSEFRFQH